MYFEAAKDYGAPEKVLSEIKEGLKIPHFWNPRHFFSVTGAAWQTFMHPAQKLMGNEGRCYYHALVKEQVGSGLQADKILSYDDHMTQLVA